MMNRFLYFIPDLSACNEKMLADRGILARFSIPGGTLQYCMSPWNEGPCGSGVCVAIGGEPATYAPADQVWEDCGAFWLGMQRNATPGPLDLQREIGYRGHDIELLDGNLWRVPLLRRWNHATCEHVSSLPKSMRPIRQANGAMQIRLCVAKSEEHLDQLAEEIWQAYVSAQQWTLENLYRMDALLLAQNYRIGEPEMGMLALLDETLAPQLAGLAIDRPAIEESAVMHANDGIFTGGL